MLIGKGRDALRTILEELVSYTRTYCSAEEQFMKSHPYNGYPAQKMEHVQFIHKISEFQRDFIKGRLVVTLTLMDFLQNWLVHHIKVSDQKFSYLSGSSGLGVKQ